MTVDMLAATFFWPEGTLLGSHQPADGSDGELPDGRAATDAEQASGLWAAMRRHLWRASPADPASPTPPT